MTMITNETTDVIPEVYDVKCDRFNHPYNIQLIVLLLYYIVWSYKLNNITKI
jgi:hypothetical protein